MNPIPFAILLTTTLFLAGCGGGSAAPGAVAAQQTTGGPQAEGAISPEEAAAVFNTRCMTCHGLTGHGDGPGAAALDPKPRSFVDVAWQDGVTDDQIRKTIVFGGAAVGKSAMMPAQPDLKQDRATLDGLVRVIRAWRGK